VVSSGISKGGRKDSPGGNGNDLPILKRSSEGKENNPREERLGGKRTKSGTISGGGSRPALVLGKPRTNLHVK